MYTCLGNILEISKIFLLNFRQNCYSTISFRGSLNSPCYSRFLVKLGPQDLKSLPNFWFFNAAEIYLTMPDLIKHDDNNDIIIIIIIIIIILIIMAEAGNNYSNHWWID